MQKNVTRSSLKGKQAKYGLIGAYTYTQPATFHANPTKADSPERHKPRCPRQPLSAPSNAMAPSLEEYEADLCLGAKAKPAGAGPSSISDIRSLDSRALACLTALPVQALTGLRLHSALHHSACNTSPSCWNSAAGFQDTKAFYVIQSKAAFAGQQASSQPDYICIQPCLYMHNAFPQ